VSLSDTPVGIYIPGRSPQLHDRDGVLEITGRGHCAEIHPPAEVGVADEPSVPLVAVTEDDAVLNSPRTLQWSPIDELVTRSPSTCESRPIAIGPMRLRERRNHRAFTNQDWAR